MLKDCSDFVRRSDYSGKLRHTSLPQSAMRHMHLQQQESGAVNEDFVFNSCSSSGKEPSSVGMEGELSS